jgi:hypothetical protein
MRYLALSTVIVVAFIAAITLIPHGAGPAIRTHYTSDTASPGIGHETDDRRTPSPVTGEAPWAFSALPECFRQDSRRQGVPAFARIGFPSAAKLLPPGTRLEIADCTVEVGERTIAVSRGENRLVVPATAHLYAYNGHLVLDRTALGREEVRVYEYAFRPGRPP